MLCCRDVAMLLFRSVVVCWRCGFALLFCGRVVVVMLLLWCCCVVVLVVVVEVLMCCCVGVVVLL